MLLSTVARQHGICFFMPFDQLLRLHPAKVVVLLWEALV